MFASLLRRGFRVLTLDDDPEGGTTPAPDRNDRADRNCRHSSQPLRKVYLAQAKVKVSSPDRLN